MSPIIRFLDEYKKHLAGNPNPEQWMRTVETYLNKGMSLKGISIDSSSFKATAKALNVTNNYLAWDKFFTDGGKNLPAYVPISNATHKRTASDFFKVLMQDNGGNPSTIKIKVGTPFVEMMLSYKLLLNRMAPIGVTYSVEEGVITVKTSRKITYDTLRMTFDPKSSDNASGDSYLGKRFVFGNTIIEATDKRGKVYSAIDKDGNSQFLTSDELSKLECCDE